MSELGRLQDIKYWNPISGQWQTTVPNFPVGHWGGLNCRGVNLSGTDQSLALRFYAYDPDGTLLDLWQTDYYVEAPGSGLSANNAVYCDVPGDYSQKCELLIAGVGVVDTVQQVVCHVGGELPPLAGHLHDPYVIDATTGETFYSLSLPVQIPIDHKVVIGVRWENDGDLAVLTAKFELIDPDGIPREIQTFDTELLPGQSTGGQTGSSVSLDKSG
ncbi:unnamed protein product, partial [marine sediment metagenome]